jgi:hypothetical protein
VFWYVFVRFKTSPYVSLTTFVDAAVERIWLNFVQRFVTNIVLSAEYNFGTNWNVFWSCKTQGRGWILGPRWRVYGFPKFLRSNTRIVLWIMPRPLSSTFCLVHYLLVIQRFMKRQTLFNDTASSSLPPNSIYGVYQLSSLYCKFPGVFTFVSCLLLYFFLWYLSPTGHADLSYCFACTVILYRIFITVTVLFCRCHAFAVLCCVLLHWLDSKNLSNMLHSYYPSAESTCPC